MSLSVIMLFIYFLGAFVSFYLYIRALEKSSKDSILRDTQRLPVALITIIIWTVGGIILAPKFFREYFCNHEYDYQRTVNNVLDSLRGRHFYHEGLDVFCKHCNKHTKIELHHIHGYILENNIFDAGIDAIVELNKIIAKIKYKHQSLNTNILNRYRNVYKVLNDVGVILPTIQALVPEKYQEFIDSQRERKDRDIVLILQNYDNPTKRELRYLNRRVKRNYRIVKELKQYNKNERKVNTILKVG